MGYNHKALGKPLSTEALPHPEFWVAGYGLAVDGAVFFSERVKQAIAEHRGEPYTPLPEADTAGAGAEEGTSLGASRVSRLDSEGGGGHSEQYDDYLGQMKLQREQSSALERVRNRYKYSIRP